MGRYPRGVDACLDDPDREDGAPSFQRDLGRGVAEFLRSEGVKVPEDSTVDDVCLMYANREWRRIPPRPRRPLWSREIGERPLADEVVDAIDRIGEVSMRGESLAPYQSTRLADPLFGDALYNEWRIHHFHLDLPSGKRAREGFVRRTSDLAFAMVTAGEILFIDVRPHDAFTDKELFQIVHRNWPEVIAPWRGDGWSVDEDGVHDHAWARKHGFTILTVVDDGTVYAPLGGGSSFTKNPIAGTVMGHVNALRNAATGLEEACLRNADKLVASRPDVPIESLRFWLHVEPVPERRGTDEHLKLVPCERVLDTTITFRNPADGG